MTRTFPIQGAGFCLLFAWAVVPLAAQQFNLKDKE